MKQVTQQFLQEIQRPSFYPIRRCYAIDSEGSEREISDYVHQWDRVIWTIEQRFRINEFLASNCSVQLKNEDGIFDIDNASNFFVSELNRSADGLRVPVLIKVGYVLEGVEELIDLFYGLIIDIDISTLDDIAILELQCVSHILRDANANNIGDQWTDQQVYGGDTHCFVVTDSGDSIKIDNNPTGNFPDGFSPFGFIKIEDEIIYYSYLQEATGDNRFIGLLRAQLGTKQKDHSNKDRIDLLLLDGNDTDGRKFQFLIYPIAQNGVEDVTTSDGTIEIWEHRHFLNLPETQKKVKGWIDYEKGILELAGIPTDSSSVEVTYKSVYRQIPYHTFVKRLLESENFDTDLVEDAILTQYLGQAVPTNYGRVTHAYDGDTPTLIPSLYPESYALCIGSDGNLYIGVEEYLIMWDGEKFNLLANLGDDKHVVRIQPGTNGNIYGVAGDKEADDQYDIPMKYVFEWDGNSISWLTGQIAAYFGFTERGETGQWRALSVDDSRDCVWFLYEEGIDLADTAGLARVDFDGTNLTKYDRNIIRFSNLKYGSYLMDFADTGDTIEFFFCEKIGSETYLQYHQFDKDTEIWTEIGYVVSDPGGNRLVPSDCVYHPIEDKIYMNAIVLGLINQGWFVSLPVGGPIS